MKKILKKATMLLCTMALTIGLVGGSSEESFAASKNYVTNGKVTLKFDVPWWLNSGRVEIEMAGATYTEYIKSGKDFKVYIKGSAATKNTTRTGTITYYNGFGTKDASTVFSITGKDLKKKDTKKVSFKKGTAGFVKSITVKG